MLVSTQDVTGPLIASREGRPRAGREPHRCGTGRGPRRLRSACARPPTGSCRRAACIWRP